MQFSTLFVAFAAAVGTTLVSADADPTTTTTVTSHLTSTVTITSCNPTVSDCPALLAAATATVTTSAPYIYHVQSSSAPYHYGHTNSTTVWTSVAGPHATSTQVVAATTTGAGSTVPNSAGANGLSIGAGLGAVAAAGAALLL